MKTILICGMKNIVGGCENYLLLMHKYLYKNLKFIFLIEETDNFIYKDIILKNNGEVVFLPQKRILKQYIEKFRQTLRNYKKETNTVYVNVNTISFDIIPIKIAIAEGYTVVTHSHNAPLTRQVKGIYYKTRHLILQNIGLARLKHSKVERLAVSQRAGDFLYRGMPYKIVSPGIEVLKFRFNEQVRNSIRNQYRLQDAVVLGFVGRLAIVKNPLFLIDVLQSTKQRIFNVKLLIVGDGDLMSEIMKKAVKMGLADDVIFSGMVSNVNEYYQAMDVLLAPSFSEGMPLGIIEAQSAGVPCVCAKGNFPETVDVTGIVHFCDLESGGSGWSNVVENILSGTVDRTGMNDTVGKTDFNIENASKKLLDILC